MNERIKDFLEQAHTYSFQENRGQFVLNDFADKFAELIVQECVAICQDTDGEANTDARSGRQDCAVEIREHFGVKE